MSTTVHLSYRHVGLPVSESQVYCRAPSIGTKRKSASMGVVEQQTEETSLTSALVSRIAVATTKYCTVVTWIKDLLAMGKISIY